MTPQVVHHVLPKQQLFHTQVHPLQYYAQAGLSTKNSWYIIRYHQGKVKHT